MKAFILAVLAVIVIAGGAAVAAHSLGQSARDAYQAHDGSVRLSAADRAP